jgi:hypothetical protein
MVFGPVLDKDHKPRWLFGHLEVSTVQLKRELNQTLSRVRHNSWLMAQPLSRIGDGSIKRLRNRFADILGLNVIFQPVVVRSTLNNRSGLTDNPIWDKAPPGAYEKALKLSSLLTLLAVHGHRAKISHDLVRLAINVWQMSLRHFNGLIGRIRARICTSLRKENTAPRKSPEASESRSSDRKSVLYGREHWCTRHQKYRLLKPEFVSLRRSKNIGLVRMVLKVLARAQRRVASRSSSTSGCTVT